MTTLTLDRTGETTPDSPETHPNPNRAQERAERARINGAKSRGPVTAEGKAKSSQNARQHGFTAKIFLVDPADEDEYREFNDGFVSSLEPSNLVERQLVDNIAQTAWNLRQADNIETDILRNNLEQGDSIHSAFTFDSKSVMAVSLYQARLDRRMHKLFDQLRKLKKDARAAMRAPAQRRPVRTAYDSLQTANFAQTNPGFESVAEETNPDDEPTFEDLEALKIALQQIRPSNGAPKTANFAQTNPGFDSAAGESNPADEPSPKPQVPSPKPPTIRSANCAPQIANFAQTNPASVEGPGPARQCPLRSAAQNASKARQAKRPSRALTAAYLKLGDNPATRDGALSRSEADAGEGRVGETVPAKVH